MKATTSSWLLGLLSLLLLSLFVSPSRAEVEKPLQWTIAQRALLLSEKQKEQKQQQQQQSSALGQEISVPFFASAAYNHYSHEQRRRQLVSVRSRGEGPNDITKSQRLTMSRNNQENEEDEGGSHENCDAAFFTCLGVDSCNDCFFQMQTHQINWAGVASNTECDTVVNKLNENDLCLEFSSEAARGLFCATFHACVVFKKYDPDAFGDDDDVYEDYTEGEEEEEFGYDDEYSDEYIDCSALKECRWPGMHESFIGDGICQDGLYGCYNTAICNWDGGDCCQDTCVSSGAYVECGVDGYYCRNPNSTSCDLQFAQYCPNAPTPPNNNNNNNNKQDDDEPMECEAGKILYRIIMYDSFGDGWDDTRLTIFQDDFQTQVYTGALHGGSQGTKYVCLEVSDQCYQVKLTGGIWGREVSWEIKGKAEGSPAIASGGAPMSCEFTVSGNACDNTCRGGSNINPEADPDYIQFKDMYKCIEEKCMIQTAACQADQTCVKCYKQEVPDFCYSIDTFNAVTDCSLCKCSDNTDPLFCSEKAAPGIVIPQKDTTPGSNGGEPCTPDEVLAGGAAILEFGKCTPFDPTATMKRNPKFDQNNFGALDSFEACSHSFNDKDDHGGHTALGCMQILVNAMYADESEAGGGGGSDGDDDDEGDKDQKELPSDAIAELAKHIYTDGEGFCDCAKTASKDCPLCPSFLNFKTLLYEILDACNALDEIDCASWDEFQKPCQTNLEDKFGTIDFSDPDQCSYVKSTCGGAGPFPAFRRLDCEGEMSAAAWYFHTLYAEQCLNDGDNETPSTPAPVPVPVPNPPAPEPNPPVPQPTPPYDPQPDSPAIPSYVPPEEQTQSSKKSSYVPPDEKVGGKKSHWFRNTILLGIIGGIGFVVYRRQLDGFNFVRYRRMGNSFGFTQGGGGYYNNYDDEGMYSGLAMESSSTFQPPSISANPLS